VDHDDSIEVLELARVCRSVEKLAVHGLQNFACVLVRSLLWQ
jgi:hypothetical protein